MLSVDVASCILCLRLCSGCSVEVLRPGCAGVPTFDYIRKVEFTLVFILLSGGLFALACGLRLCLRLRTQAARQLLSADELAVLEEAAAGGYLIDEDDDGADEPGTAQRQITTDRIRSLARRASAAQLAMVAKSHRNLHASHLSLQARAPTLRLRFRALRRGADWQDAKQRLQHSLLILLSIFYLRLVVLQFKAFVCSYSVDPLLSGSSDALTTESLYLTEDMQTRCFQGKHLAMVCAVVVMMIVYTAGFPLFCFVLLMRAFATADTPGALGYLRKRFKILRGKKKKFIDASGKAKSPGNLRPKMLRRKQGWTATSGSAGDVLNKEPAAIELQSPASGVHLPFSPVSPPRLLSDVVLTGPASPSATAQARYLQSVAEEEEQRDALQPEQHAAAAKAMASLEQPDKQSAATSELSADILQRDRENRYGTTATVTADTRVTWH